MIVLFLVLGFHIEAGRLYIINHDRIIVVASHRTIHERITEDIELIEIIQVLRREEYDNQLVDYPYNPRTFGYSNLDFLAMLDQRNDRGVSYRRIEDHQVIIMARLYYLSGRLVMVEVTEQDR